MITIEPGVYRVPSPGGSRVWGGVWRQWGTLGTLGTHYATTRHQHRLAHGPGQGAGARDTAEMRPMVTAIHQQESGHETTVKTSACSQLELSTGPFTVPREDPN